MSKHIASILWGNVVLSYTVMFGLYHFYILNLFFFPRIIDYSSLITLMCLQFSFRFIARILNHLKKEGREFDRSNYLFPRSARLTLFLSAEHLMLRLWIIAVSVVFYSKMQLYVSTALVGEKLHYTDCVVEAGIAALLLNSVVLSPVFHLMIMDADFLIQLTRSHTPGPLGVSRKSVFEAGSREISSRCCMPLNLFCATYRLSTQFDIYK